MEILTNEIVYVLENPKRFAPFRSKLDNASRESLLGIIDHLMLKLEKSVSVEHIIRELNFLLIDIDIEMDKLDLDTVKTTSVPKDLVLKFHETIINDIESLKYEIE